MKRLRVAAIQMESVNANIPHNLDKASELINTAAKKNAKLILLPEFMPTGYIFSREIWDSAEPKNGPTVTWLKNISKKIKVCLGTTFLEADGENFYNTFILVSSQGAEAGRIRKQIPAGFETYFMAGEQGSHVINSEFGKIGVGICYENQLSFLPKLLFQQSIDIHLMPHSAPTPMSNIFFPERSVELFINNFKNISNYYSKILGVPSILSNKCGKFKSPLPGMPMFQETEFMGHSAIADSDGSIKAQMGYEEGCIIGDVTLDPSKKIKHIPDMYGRWSWDAPFALNFIRMTEIQGKLNYKFNRTRKIRALDISSDN